LSTTFDREKRLEYASKMGGHIGGKKKGRRIMREPAAQLVRGLRGERGLFYPAFFGTSPK
jgi:hypothetical protein